VRRRLYRKTVLCFVMIGLGLSLSLCLYVSYRCTDTCTGANSVPPSLTLYGPFPFCYYTAHTTITYRTGERGGGFLSVSVFLFSLSSVWVVFGVWSTGVFFSFPVGMCMCVRECE